MEKCEVLIVGGGPAGSTCARSLSNAGHDVVVMDKATFPRDKICAGWVTPIVFDELEIDRADYCRSRVLQPITSFRTGMISGKAIDTNYDHPVSYGIRRCEFDEYLLNRCGATLRLGEKADSFEKTDDGWIVNGAISCRLLIGAGGHFCPVARKLKKEESPDERESVVAAQEIEFELTAQEAAECDSPGVRPEVWFCPDLAGYAWCFRKGNYLNVGMGREGGDGLTTQVKEFCESLRATGKVPQRMPRTLHGHAYVLGSSSMRPRVRDQVLLIGDSAGLAYEQSGEGIRPAVESGLLAASAVSAAHGNYSEPGLKQFGERMERRFGSGKSRHRSFLPRKIREWAAAKLIQNPGFAKRVLIEKWFLRSELAPI
ncbi:MAG: NAD(P)/FAD-dependent oxidoreductase [Phycisphaerales bacterium]